MARRKHRRHRTHRRRVGAASGFKGVAMQVAGIAAGVFLGRLATTKLASAVSPKISGLVLIVAGAYLPKFMKSQIGEGIGNGLVATGSLALLQNFGVITGIGAMPPGQSATTTTANVFNPGMKNLRVVGAPRPALNTAISGLGKINVNRMGALMEES